MTRQRKTRRTIGIDARIQAARDAVATWIPVNA